MNAIIDIHAHPQLKPLNASEAERKEKGIWKSFTQSARCYNLNSLLRGAITNTRKSSQSNLDQALAGNVKGVFLAMGPVERNFFDPQRNHFLIRLILRTRRMPDLAACITGFDLEKVRKVFNRIKNQKGVDYYSEELLDEYAFLVEQAKDKRMVIAGDFQEFEENLKKDNVVSTVLTIEGAHSLGNYHEHQDFLRNVADGDAPELYNRLMPHFENNIAHMKHWNHGRHTPLFITFCHHFGNLLAGHAKSFASGTSIKPGMDDLLNQRNGKNEGFSRLGLDVMELLLSKSNGRRVLPDVKHMSVKARMEFFTMLEEKYWKKGEKLPVICSHAAMSGYATLQQSDRPDSIARWKRNYLSRQAINMSDEEARVIARSGGLVGIVLHGGRLPGGIAKKELNKAKQSGNSDWVRDVAVKLVMSNILHFVRAVGNKSAWDCICLGTDMDGVIEPLYPYSCYEDLTPITTHLTQFFHRPLELPEIGLNRDNIRKLMYGFEPEELSEKIINGNVMAFLRKYFHGEYLGRPRPVAKKVK